MIKADDDVKDIQRTVLDIFKVVKKICDDNNIRYFAIAGTAIGAIRHKGFIPWDDDIDIAMPRKDLEKFVEIAPSLLPNVYKISGLLDKNNLVNGVVRVIDYDTTKVSQGCIDKPLLYNGIFLDVMPFDGVPNNIVFFHIHMTLLSYLFRFAVIRASGMDQISGSAYRRLLKTVLYFVSLVLPFEVYARRYINLANRYKFDDKKCKYLSRTWAFKSHDGMKARSRYYKDDFSKFIEMPFEDTNIKLPVGYDRYLSGLYPNYMTPPPKSKQKPHNDGGFTDTNRPFRYYLAKKEGKTIGYTAGCYDLFHVGHLNLLRHAKQNCDYLIVGVNSDDAMFSYKNKYPVISLSERMDILRELRCVDEVVRVDDTDKFIAFRNYDYNIIFVGDDHKGENKWQDLEKKLSHYKAEVRYLPYTQHTSSTKLRSVLSKIIENNEQKKQTTS